MTGDSCSSLPFLQLPALLKNPFGPIKQHVCTSFTMLAYQSTVHLGMSIHRLDGWQKVWKAANADIAHTWLQA